MDEPRVLVGGLHISDDQILIHHLHPSTRSTAADTLSDLLLTPVWDGDSVDVEVSTSVLMSTTCTTRRMRCVTICAEHTWRTRSTSNNGAIDVGLWLRHLVKQRDCHPFPRPMEPRVKKCAI